MGFQPFLPRIRLYCIENFILQSQFFLLNRDFKKAKARLELAQATISAARRTKELCINFDEEKISEFKKQIEDLEDEVIKQELENMRRLKALEKDKKKKQKKKKKEALRAKKKRKSATKNHAT